MAELRKWLSEGGELNKLIDFKRCVYEKQSKTKTDEELEEELMPELLNWIAINEKRMHLTEKPPSECQICYEELRLWHYHFLHTNTNRNTLFHLQWSHSTKVGELVGDFVED